MNRWLLERSCLKLMDQICSLMETTMRQRAGESGLPIGLPLHCRMQRWPRAKVCISSTVVRRDGTSLTTIFRVTFSRRKVRPLMRSPGLLDFPGETENTSLSRPHSYVVEGSPQAWTTPQWIFPGQCRWRIQPGLAWLTRIKSASTGADRRMSRIV